LGSVFNKIGGAISKLVTKTITANGTYNASSDNADGYSQVSVNVPLTTKSITANGTYNASSDNAAGYSQVSVNVKATRNLIWSGSSADGVSINLSAYNWVYIVASVGTYGGSTLLQVGGGAACLGAYQTVEGGSRGYSRAYKATTSGITALTGDPSDDKLTFRVTAIYGITNLD
jgi:hypothetical protein